MFRSSAWRVEQSRLRRLTLLSPEPPSASRRQGPSLRERETRSFSVREALHAEVRARRSRKTGQADCSSLPLWQVRTRLSEVAAFEACGSSFFLGISLTGASREESQRGLDGQSKALQNEILGPKCREVHIAAQSGAPRLPYSGLRLSKVAYTVGQRDHELKAGYSTQQNPQNL